eukprot:6009049-Prymnesium_polylepis.1
MLAYSNLGGHGPDQYTSDGEEYREPEIRYTNVGALFSTYRGRIIFLDFAITADGSYTPANASLN